MPLSNEDKNKLALVLQKAGLPSTFNGDRLGAFQLGLDVTIKMLGPLVSLDTPKDEGKKDE